MIRLSQSKDYKLENDIRFQILEELNRVGNATAEYCLNPFLSTLETYKKTGDVGTIRRALEHLIDEGLISETPRHKGVVSKIISNNEPRTLWSNPIRFVRAIEDEKGNKADKISGIFVFITLGGIRYLADWDYFKDEAHNTKHTTRNNILILFAGLLLGWFSDPVKSKFLDMLGIQPEINQTIEIGNISVVLPVDATDTEPDKENVDSLPIVQNTVSSKL